MPRPSSQIIVEALKQTGAERERKRKGDGVAEILAKRSS